VKRAYRYPIIFWWLICFSLFAHVKNEVWQVHRAAFPPVIDGKMDDLYKTASSERLVKLNQDDTAPPESYSDLSAHARLLWDNEKLYVFIKVVDDKIHSDSGQSYENDCVEYLVDGNNSKLFQDRDMDDMLIRIEYQDDSVDDVDNPPDEIEFAVADWENPVGSASGYTVEAAFPLKSLNIDSEAGVIFGLEIQVNDSDIGTCENIIRWWGTSSHAWHWAHLWGEAELADYTADTTFNIFGNYLGAPVIDGVLEKLWVDGSAEIYQGDHVTQNNGFPWNEYIETDTWDDAQMCFRAMVYADAFYFWCEMIDDEISTSGKNPRENDSIVLYFDGDNSKNNYSAGVPYDDDDQRFSWVYGSEEPGIPNGNEEIAWGEMDRQLGYTFELMIPVADLTFYPVYNKKIGFEVQVIDRDHEAREHILQWWGNDKLVNLNASLFGTAALFPVPPPPPSPAAVAYDNTDISSFLLCQNYPNPFNALTLIRYYLNEKSQVRLTIFTIQGKVVTVLDQGVKHSGSYMVRLDASHLHSGVYVCQLATDSGVITRKMLLMK